MYLQEPEVLSLLDSIRQFVNDNPRSVGTVTRQMNALATSLCDFVIKLAVTNAQHVEFPFVIEFVNKVASLSKY